MVNNVIVYSNCVQLIRLSVNFKKKKVFKDFMRNLKIQKKSQTFALSFNGTQPIGTYL
jgi:hypothetical protein